MNYQTAKQTEQNTKRSSKQPNEWYLDLKREKGAVKSKMCLSTKKIHTSRQSALLRSRASLFTYTLF